MPRERDHRRYNQEGDTHEGFRNAPSDAGFSAPSSSSIKIVRLGLGQFPGQSLRHQAQIRAASTAVLRAVDILSRAFGTVHTRPLRHLNRGWLPIERIKFFEVVFNTLRKHTNRISIAGLYLDNGRDQSWDQAVALFVRSR